MMDKEEFFIKKQIEFMREIDLHNAVSISAIKRIAGVDLAYWKKGEDEYAKCIQGLANDKVSPGVLKQLSIKYPNLRIEVTSEIIPNIKITGKSSFIIQNGVYVK